MPHRVPEFMAHQPRIDDRRQIAAAAARHVELDETTVDANRRSTATARDRIRRPFHGDPSGHLLASLGATRDGVMPTVPPDQIGAISINVCSVIVSVAASTAAP